MTTTVQPSQETQITRLLRQHGAVKFKTHPSGLMGIRDRKERAWFFYEWDNQSQQYRASGSSSMFG